MDQSNTPGSAEPVKAQAPEAAPAPVQPLTPSAWLMQNGPFILLLASAITYAYYQFGSETLIMVAKAAVGLGFVIFIHELGHFLAAKWCDVHVMTFSIGFGPAVPGCSFTRGETTYKLAILPLGGYVNMVGEGPEADEDEEYPRSFKNKTVGQRMLIISAGVIMNVLFGAACFVAVYLTQGVARHPAVVWKTDPGSRAWEAGVKSGWTLSEIEGRKDPWWHQMFAAVALSSHGQSLDMTFTDRSGEPHRVLIEPFRDDNYDIPFIGVAPLPQLKLIPARYKRLTPSPVLAVSAAASARVIPLNKGDVVVAASSVENPEKLTPLPVGTAAWMELAGRLEKLSDKDVILEVRRGGKGVTEKVNVAVGGFNFGDSILGMTDLSTPDEPFHVTKIRVEAVRGTKKKMPDPFDYRERMNKLAGKPVVLEIQREVDPPEEGAEGEIVQIFVPPAYHATFGARMKMGKIAKIRKDSPASGDSIKGPTQGDMITGVKLLRGAESAVVFKDREMDPVRLPFELQRQFLEGAKQGKKTSTWQVELTVIGTEGHDAGKVKTLDPMSWDDSYSLADESPRSAPAPMSIPQLGIAYWVDSVVAHVEPGSPAEKAGLKPGDEIQEIAFRKRNGTKEEIRWMNWEKMSSKRERGQELYDQWAYHFAMLQGSEYPQFRVKVKRDGGTVELPGAESGSEEGIIARPDTSWPLDDRGITLIRDMRRQKARTIVEALVFGFEDTVESIKQIYMNLSRLLSRRISTRSLGGPIEIASQAYAMAGEDLSTFAMFLAIISINLAVVNFLPIPLLDGGHMVFLVYEKLRGRPPSEMVRVVATYIGLAFILSLMGFVMYLDGRRRGWW